MCGGGEGVSCWILAACEHAAVMLPDSSRKAPIRGEKTVVGKQEKEKQKNVTL